MMEWTNPWTIAAEAGQFVVAQVSSAWSYTGLLLKEGGREETNRDSVKKGGNGCESEK